MCTRATPQLSISSIYCPEDANNHFFPKHKSLDKNTNGSLLHHCIIVCYFITILSSDILCFQHSSTILHKCKVKLEFLSESLITKNWKPSCHCDYFSWTITYNSGAWWPRLKTKKEISLMNKYTFTGSWGRKQANCESKDLHKIKLS